MEIICTAAEKAQLIKIFETAQETLTIESIRWVIKEDLSLRPPFQKGCKNCYWVEDFGDKCICRDSIHYGEKVVQWGESFSASQSSFGKCDKWKVSEN